MPYAGQLSVPDNCLSRRIPGVIESIADNVVIFVGNSEVSQGTAVEVTIILPYQIRVSSPGKVARLEVRSAGNIAVAVELIGPLSESLETLKP